MLKIKKDGYEISQAENNHVMICKNGQMLFHVQTTKKCKDEKDLLKYLDNYFELTDKLFLER